MIRRASDGLLPQRRHVGLRGRPAENKTIGFDVQGSAALGIMGWTSIDG